MANQMEPQKSSQPAPVRSASTNTSVSEPQENVQLSSWEVLFAWCAGLGLLFAVIGGFSDGVSGAFGGLIFGISLPIGATIIIFLTFVVFHLSLWLIATSYRIVSWPFRKAMRTQLSIGPIYFSAIWPLLLSFAGLLIIIGSSSDGEPPGPPDMTPFLPPASAFRCQNSTSCRLYNFCYDKRATLITEIRHNQTQSIIDLINTLETGSDVYAVFKCDGPGGAIYAEASVKDFNGSISMGPLSLRLPAETTEPLARGSAEQKICLGRTVNADVELKASVEDDGGAFELGVDMSDFWANAEAEIGARTICLD